MDTWGDSSSPNPGIAAPNRRGNSRPSHAIRTPHHSDIDKEGHPMIGTMTLTRSGLSSLRWLAPRSVAGAVVALAMVVGLSLKAQAGYSDVPAVAPPAVVAAPTTAPAVPSFPAPGQYLFGQSAQPDHIGSGYIVMESNGQDLYGALYFPGSSFDCFRGRVQGNALAMTIIDSYSQEAYPYSIALEPQGAIAADALQDGLAPLNLSGFHALSTLSDNDLRMLNICKADLAPES